MIFKLLLGLRQLVEIALVTVVLDVLAKHWQRIAHIWLRKTAGVTCQFALSYMATSSQPTGSS